MRPARTISEEQKEVIVRYLKDAKTKGGYQRVLCLWLRVSLGLDSNQIATGIGWQSATSVRRVQSQFFKEGEQSLSGPGRGGRRRENLTLEQERLLLSAFFEKAEQGVLLVATEVKRAYEQVVGHPVPKSTIYRMLARHEWRKIVPRPHHPKANVEQQADFKKNSLKS
jgi:transposase